jgi:hypothetical protein
MRLSMMMKPLLHNVESPVMSVEGFARFATGGAVMASAQATTLTAATTSAIRRKLFARERAGVGIERSMKGERLIYSDLR